jgi:hypothetical protein
MSRSEPETSGYQCSAEPEAPGPQYLAKTSARTPTISYSFCFQLCVSVISSFM